MNIGKEKCLMVDTMLKLHNFYKSKTEPTLRKPRTLIHQGNWLTTSIHSIRLLASDTRVMKHPTRGTALAAPKQKAQKSESGKSSSHATVSKKLDSALVLSCVRQILKHQKRKQSSDDKMQLIDDFARPILVQIQLTNSISKRVQRPVRVALPHSIYAPDVSGCEHSVCFFCRSKDKSSIIAGLQHRPFPGLDADNAVLSIDDVRKLFIDFKDRKKLLTAYTHFVCDAAVMSQLYNLLGKVFSDRLSSRPVPVSLPNTSAEAVHKALERALVSVSYMHLSGNCTSLRVGMTSMSAQHVADNVMSGVGTAVDKVSGGWGVIHSIHVKASDSAALPIFYKNEDQMLQFLKKRVAESSASTEHSAAEADHHDDDAEPASASSSSSSKKASSSLPSSSSSVSASASTAVPKKKKSSSSIQSTSASTMSSSSSSDEVIVKSTKKISSESMKSKPNANANANAKLLSKVKSK